MKFKKLDISNLASLEEACIDFGHAPLDQSIFLICGETGSGKSTLLDAICLALYGNSPRFEASSSDKFRLAGVFGEVSNDSPMQILRENAEKGYAELVFEGNDEKVYTARWAVRRKKKRGVEEHENEREWTLRFVEDEMEITLKKIEEVRGRIEQAVGLNFEQFCRTSMLAQGEFTKFLKSNDTDKSAILEKLTDTGHFARMGVRIYEKAGEKKKQWEQVSRDIENLQLLSPEQVEEKEAERASLAERVAGLAKEWESLKKRYDWERQEADLQRKKKGADERVKQAQEGVQGEDYRRARQMLQEWEVSEEARRWLEQSREAEREGVSAARGLQGQETEFSVLWGGVKYLEDYIKELERRTGELENALGAGAGEVPDVAGVETRLQAYARTRLHAERFGDRSAMVRKAARELAELEKECGELAAHTEVLMRQAREREEKWKNADEDLKTLQKGVGDMAKGLRATLSVGENCPVCGSRIEKLLTDDYFENLYAPAKKRCDEAETAYKEADNLLKTNLAERKAKDGSLEAARQRLQENRRQCVEAEAQLKQALQGLQTTPDAGIDPVDALVSRLADEENRLRKHLTLMHDLQQARAACEKCLQPYRDAAALVEELRDGFGGGARLQPAPAQAQKDLIPRLSDVKSKVVSLRDRRASALRQKENLTRALTGFYALHPGMTEARLTQLLDGKAHIEDGKVFCKRKDDALTAALATQAQIEKEQTLHASQKPVVEDGAGGGILDGHETPETLAALLADREREREAANRRLGALDQLLKAEEAQRRKLSEKMAERERLRGDCERWEHLNKLFGSADGKKFRKIVLNFMMDELLSHANDHLQRLTDRYRLESSFGSFVILVRDLHDGGSLRSASSLSGGESFLVSLALALGLSSFNGSRVTTDILFIDEGFGTLSGNALEPAVSALERLHNSDGRKVAIISHVAALRERIRTQIQVERIDPTRSRVRVTG